MEDLMAGDLETRVAELEHQLRRRERREGAETAFWALMHSLFPEEARKHMKAAGREQLLAARAYLDHWIRKLEEEHPAPAEAERIEVG